MRRALGILLLCFLPACAIAFTSGSAITPPPPKFQDTDHSALREEQKKEEVASSMAPSVGVSLVVGGERMDAGSLPKAPFPVVLLP
jgi:hypothetical protein